MKMRTMFITALCLIGALLAFTTISSQAQTELTPKEELGMMLYFDETLSEPDGQACASCHDPDFGFADPDRGLPVSEGVIPGLFGGRNSPSSAYAMYAPIFYLDSEEGLWTGGQFWDGRGTGEVLGDPLADQALGPFLAGVEMANPSKYEVVRDVLASDYADLFLLEIGFYPITELEIAAAYDQIGLAIAAFERTEMFAPFTSKYDYYLQQCLVAGGNMDDCAKGVGSTASAVGTKIFSKKEWYGLQLFMNDVNDNDGVFDPGEGAVCVACHVADWTVASVYGQPVQVPDWAPDGMVPPVFTDFTFDNLGIPKSEDKLLVDADVDLGLGAVVGDPDENGKFKVMTLRNIAQTAPYGHNGIFGKLEEIIHFYNTRDVTSEGWPSPEYPDTVNFDELGNLGLSDKDEDALVKFMKTLTDGWMP